MRKKIDIKIVNKIMIEKNIPLPSYATAGSAGLDLRACIEQSIIIEPQKRVLIGTGIALDIKDHNIFAMLASRSGLSLKHGIRVAQGVGVIDADYHGEIGVILANDSDVSYTVNQGDKIAQLLFMPVIQADLMCVEEFSAKTTRDTGGFGSTGY